MNNLFKDISFGKAFRTADGKKAIFHHRRKDEFLFIFGSRLCAFAYDEEGHCKDNLCSDIVSEWEEDCIPAVEAKNLNSEIVDLKTKLVDILNAKEQDVDFYAREAYPTLSIENRNGDTVGYDNHDKEREIYKKGYLAALSNIHFVLNH